VKQGLLADFRSDRKWLRLNYVMWVNDSKPPSIILRTVNTSSPRRKILLHCQRESSNRGKKFREVWSNLFMPPLLSIDLG
jgi:hypothetical protein